MTRNFFEKKIHGTSQQIFVSYLRLYKQESVHSNMKDSSHSKIQSTNPVSKDMFKVSIRTTRTRCEIYSRLTIKTPEWFRYLYY